MAAKKSTKSTASKQASTKKAPAKKASTKKAPAKKVAKKAAKAAQKAPAKKVAQAAKKMPAKKAPAATKAAKKKSLELGSAEAKTSSIVGKKAPSFDLVDQAGKRVTSAGLKGKPYVLYFYPKDNTPGCTKEACDFRDAFGNFRRSKVTVLGVSPDSEKSHANFANKYALPFPLLVDAEKSLAQAYGAWALKKNYGREYWGIVRSTFLIGADGKVKREWRGVRVAGHVDAVLEEARA